MRVITTRQVEKLCGLKRATGGGAPESLKIISPIHLITETTAFPPTILISAGKDIHVSKLQSERFHAKLSQCNAKSWIHFCPDSNHFSFLFGT